MSAEQFLPAASFFPGRSPRWVCDVCRGGKIPGATKIGGGWFLRAIDAERIASSTVPKGVPSVDAALADLRARGVL